MTSARSVFTSCLPSTSCAQHGAGNGEWRTWAGDLGATRYAPLDQITAANFKTLQVAWRFGTDNLGTRPDFNLQTTPLMINGVLYATAGEHRNAVALDAATGELLWMHRLEEGARAQRSSRRLSGRGVGYWTDGKGDERVFYVTIGYQLVGLDAKTGKPLKDFGVNGVVDLKKDADQELDPVEGEIAWNGAPVVAKNVVLVGAAHRAGTAPRSRNERQGLHPRLRRAHRQAAVDLPHHSDPGRVRQRYVARKVVGVHRQHRRVDADDGGRAARHRLPAGRDSHRRLLRRPSSRQQPVRGEPGRGRSADRQAHLALPVRAPSDLGLRRAVRADPRRHHGRRPQDCRRGAAHQAGLHLRVRSQDRRAGVADRRAGGRERHGAARVVFADATLPHQAAVGRAPGIPAGVRDRLHAGAEGRRRWR